MLRRLAGAFFFTGKVIIFMKKVRYIVFDVETGGLDIKVTPITQIGLVSLNREDLTENARIERYVKPYCGLTIDLAVLAKTQVTMDLINRLGIPGKTLVSELIDFFRSQVVGHPKFGKAILAGHNVVFDINFLAELFALHGKYLWDHVAMATVDTLGLAKMLWENQEEQVDKLNLSACCTRIGYTLTGAHGAMNDVEATIALLKYAINRMKNNQSSSTVPTGEAAIRSNRKFFQF